MPVPSNIYDRQYNRLDSWLKNGSDSIDMNVDGSGTPVSFFYQCPANETALLERLNVNIRDTGAVDNDLFGVIDLSGGTGITVKVLDSAGNDKFDFLDGQTIKYHMDFTYLAGTDAVATVGAVGATFDVITIRWTLSRAGLPVRLFSSEKFEIKVQDNLTGLNEFRCKLQGRVDYTID